MYKSVKNEKGFSGVIVIVGALLVVGLVALFMIRQVSKNELEVEVDSVRSEQIPVTYDDSKIPEFEPIDELSEEDESSLPVEIQSSELEEIDALFDDLDSGVTFEDLEL